MRVIVTIGVILIMLLTGGFWTIHLLTDSTEEIIRQIDLVSAKVKADQWGSAVYQTNKLADTWEIKARWWPVFLDHQEMDNIDFSMAKVKEYVSSHNNSLSLGQLSELKLMVEHIPETEAVNIKNIL